ncbi:hypothetical protein [Microcoleus sp. D2_18a_D3]|uniref:hypothetical protein n=1 Tax=Microcoleus sp. D2_18a_D3 TaxID=3055330 RepID=UPI002FD2E370
MLVRSSVTAKDLFNGRNSIALALVMHSRAIVLTWMPEVGQAGRAARSIQDSML